MTRPSVPVDVVVVAYNSASSLSACLTSVVGDGAVSRVVVVDNCSEDDSPQVAAELGAEVLPAGRNGGFGAGCNTGVRATTAPFVLLLNPDASVEPGTVAGLRDMLEAHPETAAVGSVVIDPHGRSEPVRRRFPALRRVRSNPAWRPDSTNVGTRGTPPKAGWWSGSRLHASSSGGRPSWR